MLLTLIKVSSFWLQVTVEFPIIGDPSREIAIKCMLHL